MSILDIFRSRDKPKDKSRTAGSQYTFYTGMSQSGKVVNERSAMQMSAVYACVRVLSEAVAQLPLHLYRYRNDGSKEKAIDNPLYRILHDQPNNEMSSFTFRETMMVSLLLNGNAYSQVIRNGHGQIVALYPLMASRMQVYRNDSGQLYYVYSRQTDEANSKKSEQVVLMPDDVLHIRAMSYDGIVGYSPIAIAKNSIGLGLAAEEYGSKFYSNGASLSGVLETSGTIKDPQKLRDSWMSQFSGSENSHKIAVLEDGLQFKPISISPSDAEFIETRKFQIDEIARIFRVPPHMIGDLDKSSFSNIEEMALEFATYSLAPWLNRWEQEIQRSLLTDEEKNSYFVRFNVDGILRGDYQSRMNGYAIGIQNGFMSPNDVRELENMDLIPDDEGGNKYMVNGNMLPLKQAGAYATNKEETNDEEVLELQKSGGTGNRTVRKNP